MINFLLIFFLKKKSKNCKNKNLFNFKINFCLFEIIFIILDYLKNLYFKFKNKNY